MERDLLRFLPCFPSFSLAQVLLVSLDNQASTTKMSGFVRIPSRLRHVSHTLARSCGRWNQNAARRYGPHLAPPPTQRMALMSTARSDLVYETSSKEDSLESRIEPSQRDFLNRLLDVEKSFPIGSFTPETWFQAEELLDFLPGQRTYESIDLSFRLFERMLVEGESGRSSYVETEWKNVDFVNRMVNNWRVQFWEHEIPVYSPENVLELVTGYALNHGVEVNEKTFFLVAESVLRKKKDSSSLEFAEKVLDRSFQLFKENGMRECRPSTQFWNVVLRSWTYSNRKEAPQKSEDLLEKMLSFQVKLNPETYLHLITVWSNTNSLKGAKRAEELLWRMFDEYQQGDKSVAPNHENFRNVLIAWSKSGSHEASQHADELVNAMLDCQRDGHFEDTADLVPALNTAIQCHALAKSRAGAKKAQAIMSRMEGLNRPNYITYLNLIKCWAQVGGIDEVEALIKRMNKLVQTGRKDLRPDCVIMTAAISACAKSRAENKLERAEDILHQMNHQSDPNLRPTTITYNTFLDCLSRTRRNWPGTKAEKVLAEMKSRAKAGDDRVKPNITTFSTVINTWARLGNAHRAAAVLQQMYDEYLAGNEEARPNLYCLNTVLAAYIRSDLGNEPKLAESLLKKMIRLSAGSLVDVKPDVYSYASVLACYASVKHDRREAADQATRLLNEMRNSKDPQQKPNAVCYNAVLNAWARARDPRAASSILEMMYKDYAAGNEDAKPRLDTFNTLLKAWAYSRSKQSGDRALNIIEKMKELHSSGALDVAPNVVSYTTAILCFGLSRVPGGPARADEILTKMDSLHKQGQLDAPSEITWTTLRKAWIGSKEPNRDERVKAIDKEIEERFGPRRRRSR